MNVLDGQTRPDVSIIQGQFVSHGNMKLKICRLNRGVWLCYAQLSEIRAACGG